MTSVQIDLLNLGSLRAAVSKTLTLRGILDDSWFDLVEGAIRKRVPSSSSPVDPTGFFYDFCHPLRGAEWFEKIQALALSGRVAEVDNDGRFALGFTVLDPTRTVLPKVDDRLTAYTKLPFKQNIISTKLSELRAARGNPSFKNHLFEMLVLGDFALRGVLVDIEDASTAIDGVIRIDGRDILVEATNTAQEIIPDFFEVISGDPNVEIDQVEGKLRKKVTESRQIAKAAGKPAILFLARTRLGASRKAAQIALKECFAVPDFSKLSGVVLSDSYKLYVTSWNNGKAPDVPLTEKETEALNTWYGQK